MVKKASFRLVNLTPHDLVVVLGENGDKITIPKSGKVARVLSDQVLKGEINGIPVFEQTFGEIVDLPDPEADTYYIVSAIVLAAAKAAGRTDCLAPNTSKAIRDEAGNIIGVPGFVR